MVEFLPYTQAVGGSSPSRPTKYIRSVAQSGSAPGLGPGGPRFESLYSDQYDAVYGRGLSVQSHKLRIAGSNPATATNKGERNDKNKNQARSTS